MTADKRLPVSEETREELRKYKKDGETWDRVIRREVFGE